MKTIKTKLMTMIGSMILVSCLLLGGIACVASVIAIGKTINRDIQSVAEQTAQTVGLSIDGKWRDMASLSTIDLTELFKKTDEEINEILYEEANKICAMRVAVCDLNGNARYSDGVTVDVSDKEFYTQAMSGTYYISSPEPSLVDGELAVVYAVPISANDGTFVGVALRENFGYEYSYLVNEAVFGNTGTGFILDEEGTYVAHPNDEIVANAYNPKAEGTDADVINMVEKMSKGEIGSDQVVQNGQKLNVGFAPISGTDWMVGITINHEEVYAPMIQLIIQLAVMTIVIMLVSLFVLLIISRGISKQIVKTTLHLGKVAEGDLTGTIDGKLSKQKDELGQMGRSLETMKSSISAIISNVKDNSNSLSEKSNELNSNSEEISKLSNNITTAINEIAEGTSVQSNELITITTILEQFNQKLQTMITEIEDVDDTSRKIDGMANKSTDEMNELNESVNQIRSTFKDFEKSIVALGSNITEINNITNLITDVADQTNLLALNASIEAARAGEAGKGFAVVAQEIGSLAEQSKNSSASINRLIDGIAQSTGVIVNDAKGMGNELNEQVETINRSIDTFRGIINEIGDVIPKIQKVKESGHEIDQDKNTILSKIDELSSVSEEISASSEEIAASTEEMNESIENVADSAKMLNGMTEEMLGQVNQFTLD